LPTQALKELQEAPYNLIADVLDVRSFIRTKQALDRVKPGSDMPAPEGPMADRVWDAIRTVKEERDEERQRMLREAGLQ